ncbi:MAG: 5-demethoxyubiquinol-8 5-hydroxylase UbiM, partial [Xanthomonadales bacterium]|nr:5-demethoxyubiquinol-8 5-hydroxylase UbiM [Xanthomonadales bacterium]
PIKEAKVLDGDSSYALHFDRADIPEEMLGYIVSNHVIRKALYEKVGSLNNVEILPEVSVTGVKTDENGAVVSLSNGKTADTALVVSADSRFSETRRKMGISADMHEFGRVCIVSRMRHERSNEGIAHECFFYGQTLAVLPLSDKESSIVITVSSDMADHIMAMDKDEFSRHVEGQFKGKLQRMDLSSERFPYPLVAVWANKFIGQRYAVIGDAAVGMHPVTAHGFNLGLRSQHTLAELIRKAHADGKDIGANGLLKRYEKTHRKIARPIYLGTNAIVKLFTNDMPLHKLARKTVLRVGNIFPPIKRAITHQLTETSG